MSSIIRKQDFCICENSGADQLSHVQGNQAADQYPCCRYIDSTIPLLPILKFQLLAILCDYTAWFLSDLFGNPEDRFSCDTALIRKWACLHTLQHMEVEKNRIWLSLQWITLAIVIYCFLWISLRKVHFYLENCLQTV